MKLKNGVFFRHGFKCLAAVFCSLLLFGSVLLITEKQQDTVPVYAEEDGVADFVSRLYEYVLEREADEGGLTTWTDALQNGTFTGTEVAKGFIMSDEFLGKDMSNEEFVQILYRAFFGREADPSGLATWVDFLDQGYRKSYVFAGFANSNEFGTLCDDYDVEGGSVPVTVSEQQPGLSDEEYNTWLFVERLYTEVLGRTPDVLGLGEWAGYLQDGTFSGAEVAKGFILSTEFEGKEVSNEEYVQIMYKTFFGREADPAGLETWTNALETDYSKRYVFAGFANSTEFGNLCDSYEIEQGEVSALEVVPTAPYSIVIEDGSVHLCWNAVEGMTQYGVWRSETGANGEYTWLGNTDQLEYYDANVVSGTTYHYKITAFDTGMQVHSDKSEAIEITYEEMDYSYLYWWEEQEDGTIMLGGYNGYEESTVIVPDNINGMTVTAIGSDCFAWHGEITDITLPNTITTIGEYAFEGCSSLEHIVIPESVVEIYPYAFDSCHSLTTLHIPAGVKNFYAVFEYDEDGVLVGGTNSQETMYDCMSMVAITVDEKNTAYAAVDGILYNKDKTQLIYVPNAYKGTVIIADTVVEMEVYSAFEGCSEVTKIVIPKNMTYFDNAITGCTSLENYTVAEGNEAYVAVDGVLFSKDETRLLGVPNKVTGTTYTIPAGVTWVDTCAFFSCEDVEQINIPASVCHLGVKSGSTNNINGYEYDNCYRNVFYACDSLQNIVVDNANTYFKSISGVLFSADDTVLVAYPKAKEAELFKIPTSVTTVADRAFMYCNKLQAVSIPSSVEVLQPRAFYNAKMENVYFAEGVYRIGTMAFSHCLYLTEIALPNSVDSIETRAFYGCTSLDSIDMPESLSYLGEEVFSGCKSLSSISIPEGITEIPERTFYGCYLLEKVEFPSTLETIKSHAFYNCSFSELTLPEGLTTIEERAFRYCSNLKFISIPEGVTELPKYAFEKSSSLTEVELPASLVTIDKNAFAGCYEITTVYAPAGSYAAEWAESVGYEVLENREEGESSSTADWFTWTELEDGTVAITGINYDNFVAGEVIEVPATIDGKQVTTLRSSSLSYSGSNCIELILPEGLTIIEDFALQGAYYESISIPSTVTKIGLYAFAYCSNLTQLVVDEDNACYTSASGVLYSKDYTTLLQVVGNQPSCFEVPETVETISNAAFMGCNTIEEVIIPASVTSISADAFSDCANLATIEVDAANTAFNSYGTYVLSEDGTELKFIANATTELKIPASVTTINYTTISYAISMECITVEEGSTSYCAEDGVLFDYEMSTLVFYPDKKEATSYTVPETIKTIGVYAFANCNNLTEIELPANLTIIEDCAFMSCRGLTNFAMPDTVTFVGMSAFNSCTAMKEISLSSRITRINGMTFMSCLSLSNITIPEGVTEINFLAFAGCNSLAVAEIPASVTYIDATAFQNWGWGTELTIRTPEGSYAEEWATENGYATEVIYPENSETADWFYWTELSDGTVAITGINHTNFQSGGVVEVPARIDGKQVTTLKSWCLHFTGSGCTELILPEGLTTVEDFAVYNAFYESVKIPSTVEVIGTSAFAYGMNLIEFEVDGDNENYASVEGVLYSKDFSTLIQVPTLKESTSFEVPGNVTKIASMAFANCQVIEEVILSANVENIAIDAFVGCKNLANVEIAEENEAYNSVGTYIISEDGTILEFVVTSATELEIPNSVTTINPMVLHYATSLEAITVEEGSTSYYAKDGVLFTNDMKTLVCYPNKRNDTIYEMPETTTAIEAYAFSECDNLTEITFSEVLTEIGIYAFQNCDSLTELVVPDSVTTLGMGAFSYCYALESATLSDNLTEISSWLFNGCSSLNSIVIPNGVESIMGYSFSMCSGLETIEIPASVTYIESTVFEDYGMGMNPTIKTPEGSYAAEYAESNGYGLEAY